MAKTAQKEEIWFAEVADIMVKSGLNFRRAAESIGQILTPEEADNLQRRKGWEKAKDLAEIRYYRSLAENPERTKDVLLGMIIHSIKKLMEEGSYDKAVAAGMTLAKIEYGALNDNQVSVLGGLSQEQIDNLKAKLKTIKEASEGTVN